MDEQVRAYIDYILTLKQIEIPRMPKFDKSAYNDIEYMNAILDIMADFDIVDDFNLTIKHLKGD